MFGGFSSQRLDESYIVHEKIGRGAQGNIYKVVNKVNNKQYALKTVELDFDSPDDDKKRLAEVKHLEKLNHANVVSIIEYWQEQGVMYIILQYAPNGDLESIIKQRQRGEFFSESQVKLWLCQLCLGLTHIHSSKIIHRDIKSANLFLTKSNRLLIGDFGVARSLERTMEQLRTQVGTPIYLSPEICKGDTYNHKSDMWAVGVVLYEVMALARPWRGDSLVAIIRQIVDETPTPLPDVYSLKLRKLVMSLLRKNPRTRPSAPQILKLPFLKKAARRAKIQAKKYGPNANSNLISEEPRREGKGTTITISDNTNHNQRNDTKSAAVGDLEGDTHTQQAPLDKTIVMNVDALIDRTQQIAIDKTQVIDLDDSGLDLVDTPIVGVLDIPTDEVSHGRERGSSLNSNPDSTGDYDVASPNSVQICTKCGQNVNTKDCIDGDIGQVYHIRCFQCDKCDKNLFGKAFTVFDGIRLCQPCTNLEMKNKKDEQEWSCHLCTFKNEAMALACSVCYTERAWQGDEPVPSAIGQADLSINTPTTPTTPTFPTPSFSSQYQNPSVYSPPASRSRSSSQQNSKNSRNSGNNDGGRCSRPTLSNSVSLSTLRSPTGKRKESAADRWSRREKEKMKDAKRSDAGGQLEGEWTCPLCTFINEPEPVCAMCNFRKTSSVMDRSPEAQARFQQFKDQYARNNR